MSHLACETREALLRRIDARLGRTLAGRIESEDILQQAFISAIPHYRRRPVRDSRGFMRWMLQFATNEIRNSSRRRHGDESPLDWEVGSAPGPGASHAATYRFGARLRQRPGAGGRSPGAGGRSPGAGGQSTGTRQQEHVLALRDSFSLPWISVSFLLERPNGSSTRKLLRRARTRVLRCPGPPDGLTGADQI